MKEIAEKAIRTIFASTGFNIEKATDRKSVVSLIKKLRPYRIDKELVRFGANGDGGYLVPNDFEGISACFSPGVGAFSTFEEDCTKHGMQVYLADKSVDAPAINNNQFHFIKKFVGTINNDDFITMDNWVNTSLNETGSDLLLQMDIERHEYLSIINMSDALLNRCRILVIEFHYLHKLWNKEFFNMASATFEKVLQNHTCIHIHANNYCGTVKTMGVEIPKVAEFTFIRNDRVKTKSPQTNFPHPLDFDNINERATVLPECWYNINFK